MSTVAWTAGSPPAAELAALDDPIEQQRFTRWREGRDGAQVAESSFRIGGMHCASCSSTIEQALAHVDGVVDARVSAAAECASVRWVPGRTRPSALVAAIRAVGYSAVPDTAAQVRALRQKEQRAALWRLFVAAFCAMQVMMLATPAYVSAPGELAADQKQLLDWGSWMLTLPVLCFSAMPFLAGAWRSIRQRRIGMDVPVALGIVVAFVASSGAAFAPGGVFGSEVYFDSLTMFVSFLLGGRYLEMRARHRAAESLEESLGRMPQTVMRLADDGSVESVIAERLVPGDIVRVPAGDAFAADGLLVRGETRADESLLNGESRPVAKRAGDELVAGSINLGSPVEMRVLRTGADTRYEAIVALMREAQSQRPDALRAADRWAAPFLWTVLALAAAAAAAWSVIDPSRAVWVAVSVLIVTCPCALSLAAPSALLSSAAAMARRGVLLRRIDAIEGLARMKRLFIDKTGTLTQGGTSEVAIHPLAGSRNTDHEHLRAIAASLAAWSTHPASQALARRGAPDPAAWVHVEETPGRGLQGIAADGALWRLGSASWCSAIPLKEPGAEAQAWLACDGVAVARFDIDEKLRPEAVQAIKALQDDGVAVSLLSGDSPQRVVRIGRQVGVTDARGGLVPEGKLQAVREAQTAGEVVAMIGDGINDAPVLAQADVSLAMGEGAVIARAEADGVLLSNALDDVVRARRLAKETLRVVRQNMTWAAVYNAACVPLALAGWLPPWAAGLGMAASSLLVIGNSLRLSRR